ncbi:bifunctional adenosylcobinamide kinase/adenosylcobinamide-phosphate guanylyltransferase [Marinobacter sp. F4206]|uniref:bifunctional adenosylcobinamide kinase/adenosylcobinamide-phosphate guanylyltransferase n=1 Tax=Marinobacter sp. F4206 TaxID=2861777 RepID=UPI001C602B73|nr:bifunctional adenosylcobinamide kinase/adenosylcobinamide-phosphate guanylyltransferase [Marinobacter sp. F4206]MBW4935283.1 bifunctional adenosylcobinamide kinase/adenosylcobinamide-phosphate guanylyltransferase [Marinobacter sp. F4206]
MNTGTQARAHTLVLGGIRSGKTALAESVAVAWDRVTYVATATAGDDEMAARIAHHRDCRPDHWGLVEEPLHLAWVLETQARSDHPPGLLIDCMSLWVSNLLFARDGVFESERNRFLESLPGYPGPVAIVSNEVGLGTIGMDPLTRRFADELGWLNQALAARCHRVVLSVAGLPQILKGSGF